MSISVGAIKQALVRALRDIDALKTAVGSNGFNESIATVGAKYPLVIYDVAATSRVRQFGTEGYIVTTVDIWAVSDDQVEAHNLDQLILDGMENITLDFSGIGSIAEGDEPSTLLCRRLRDLSFAGIDDAGNKVYRAGGTYQIWTDRL